MTNESHHLTNGDAKKVETAADRVFSAVRLVAVLCMFILVFQFALQWQILQLDDHTGAAEDNTAELKVEVNEVGSIVSELEAFVDSVEEVTPEEQANSTAVQNAVSLVPIILDILCEIVPDSDNCQGR